MTLPLVAKGHTLLIEPDPVYEPSIIARPDISPDPRPESGVIVQVGTHVNSGEYPIGQRIAFHPDAGFEWGANVDGERKKYIVLQTSEVRLFLDDDASA